MLSGKAILVFGGLGLIGRALVEGILAHGGIAVLASRRIRGGEIPEPFASRPADVRQRIHAVQADVTDAASVSRAFEVAQAVSGRLDAVVNLSYPRNVAYGKRFEDVQLGDFHENVDGHLGGSFLVCQHAVKIFTAQGFGNIVNCASVYGIMAPRFQLYEGTAMTKEVEYAVAKSGIAHLTKYLARYTAGRNIRVNCVSPGGIFDHQPDAFVERYNNYCTGKGMLAPEDVVGAFLFLLSDLSRYVNGQNIIVDDGFSL